MRSQWDEIEEEGKHDQSDTTPYLHAYRKLPPVDGAQTQVFPSLHVFLLP